MRSQARFLAQLAALIDTVLIAMCLCLTWAGPFATKSGFFLGVMVVPSWIALLRFFGVYESHRIDSLMGTIRKVLTAHFVGGLLLLTAISLPGFPHDGKAAAELVALSTALIVVERTTIHAMLRLVRKSGLDVRSVILIGTWEQAQTIAQTYLEHREWGLEVTCVGVGPPAERTFYNFKNRQEVGRQIEAVIEKNVVDELLIAVPPEQIGQEQATVHTCERYGILGRIMLIGPQIEIEHSENLCGALCFPVGQKRQISMQGRVLKRAVDLAVSATLLAGLAPLLAAIALAVKLSSPGPVIFRQTRVGLHGRKFVLYKFRTMVDRSEAILPALAARTIMRGPIYKSVADPRVTDMGRLLRRFSLDELPQLVNVLKGEMSLVGPRPLPTVESDAIPGEYRRRFSMRPGLTCLWQVNGRSDVSYVEWMQYDLQYVDGWSLWLDATLIIRTIPAVLGGKGAY